MQKKDKHDEKIEENLENNETEEVKNNSNDMLEEESDILKSKNEKIEELEKQIEEYKDKVLRKAAEFENYKRRTENDQLNLLKYAAENFIIKLLPSIDDFERSLQHMENAKDLESIKKGIHLVYDKMMKVFEDQGVTKINAVGEPFDVNFHEALMQRKDDSVPSHTVLDEIEKGYIYKDKVIRHSKVVVSEENEEIEDSTAKENAENKPEDKE